jgi:hypothetical protein
MKIGNFTELHQTVSIEFLDVLPGPITTQRRYPQCLYPMMWDKANK